MSTGLAEREKAEEDLNPGQQHQDNLTDFSGAANPNSSPDMSAFENSFKNDTADPSQENANIQNAKERENTEGRSGGAQKKEQGSKSSTANSKPISGGNFGKVLNFAKKSGPFGVIVLIFGVVALFLGVISTPGLAIVQISEAFKSDLNDVLSGEELRTNHIFRAKMKNKVTAGCDGAMKHRCKFKSMSDNQMKKMRKAGFSFEPDPPRKNAAGRWKISGITYLDSSGQKVTVAPKDFQRMYRTDKKFRSMTNAAHNPKWKALRDSRARAAFSKFRVTFTDKLGGKKRSQMADTVKNTVRNGGAGTTNINNTRRNDEGTDEDKQRRADAETEARQQLAGQRSGSMGVKNMLGGGMRAANTFTGAQEAICGIAKATELTSHASRILQYAQLMRYASLFFTAADKLKIGEQTHEEMDFLGDILMHTDMREEVIAEDSLPEGLTDILFDEIEGDGPELDAELKGVPNPDYGKSAIDSAGVKTAMYGSPTQQSEDPYALSMRESQYIVGGGMGHVIDGIVTSIRGKPTLNEEWCGFWENPMVQGGGLLLSIAAVVGTAGTSLFAQGAKMAAQMIAVNLVMNFINGKISDMLSGENLDENTKGVDAGNAWFSGAGATFANSASARGMTPASTQDEIRSMHHLKVASLQTDAAVARYEARDTPFDIMNQYSFLGSIVWNISPATISAKSNLKTAALAPFQILSSVPKMFAPTASAAPLDLARYDKCADPVLRGNDDSINLETADIMCNLRFSETEANLNADPERVADWVIDSAQADPDSGEPVKDRDTMRNLDERRVSNEEVSTAPSGERGEMNVIDAPVEIYPQTSLPRDPANMTVAEVLRPDDDTLAYYGIPLDTSSDKVAAMFDEKNSIQLAAIEDPAVSQSHLPPPLNDAHLLNNNQWEPERDVRTYAHWYRYCRYGPEDGRTVQIGMRDTDDEEEAFDIMEGLDLKYLSDGRECLRSNACKPGDDPNGRPFGLWMGERAMKARCRPAQYDIYAIFHMDNVIENGMEEEDTQNDTNNLNLGNAQEMAQQVLDNENIILMPATREALQKFADTGVAINGCGDQFVVNPLLSWIMLKNAEKYKIWVNNYGFREDRNLGCEGGGYQHPKGNAIDLNGIERLSDNPADEPWRSMNYSGGQTEVITEYAADWMNGLLEHEPTRGRAGQTGCGGFNLLSHPDRSKWEGPDGNLHFNDSCDHLHIEATDRIDIYKEHPS